MQQTNFVYSLTGAIPNFPQLLQEQDIKKPKTTSLLNPDHVEYPKLVHASSACEVTEAGTIHALDILPEMCQKSEQRITPHLFFPKNFTEFHNDDDLRPLELIVLDGTEYGSYDSELV